MTREYYVGGDAHKDFVTVTIMSPNGKDTEVFDVAATPAGMDEIIEKMGKKKWCYMAEASTYSIDLHNHLLSRGVVAFLVDPYNLKLITDGHKKTDENDSYIIAQFLRLWRRDEIKLSISFIVKDSDQKLRDLSRERERYGREKGKTIQRIRSHMRKNGEYVEDEVLDNLETLTNLLKIRKMFEGDRALMHLLDDYGFYLSKTQQLDKDLDDFYNDMAKKEKERITDDNREEVEKARRFIKQVKIMESFPGIGRTTAIQLQSAFVDIDRFETNDQMRSFYGMAPNVRNSGGKVNCGHITKRGDRMVRAVLVRAASSYRRFGGTDIARFFDTHCQSMGKKKAKVACANMLLDRLFAALKRGTGYRYP